MTLRRQVASGGRPRWFVLSAASCAEQIHGRHSDQHRLAHDAVGRVGSPPKINVIPSTSEATLDCRLLPGVNKDEFISEMKARINDPRISIELASAPGRPRRSNSRTPLFEAIRRAIVKHHPDAIVTPMLVRKGIRRRGYAPCRYAWTRPWPSPGPSALSQGGDPLRPQFDRIGSMRTSMGVTIASG